ncbi:MAG: HEAT repeat domain-containing protein [Acidimicrobiia bacterium]
MPHLLLVSVAVLLAFNISLALAVGGLRLRNTIRKRRWDRLEATWEPRLLQLVAGEYTPESLAALVPAGEVEYVIEITSRMVQLLAGEDLRTVQAFGTLLLPQVVHGFSDRRPATRARTVHLVSLLDLPGHAGLVVASLDDSSPLVAMVAARALARQRDEDYLAEVLKRLDRFRLWSPGFLASMLASVGPSIAPLLRRNLEDSNRSDEVRVVAAEALARLRDAAGADAAAGVLGEREPARDLAASCLRLIEKVGTAQHRSSIGRMVGSEDYVVRSRAVAALAAVGDETDVADLEMALRDPSPWVAIQAARALSRLGHLETLERVAGTATAGGAVAREVLMEAA